MLWMIEQVKAHGYHRIEKRTVIEFEDDVFPDSTDSIAIKKVSISQDYYWMRKSFSFISSITLNGLVTCRLSSSRHRRVAVSRANRRALPGRGRPREEWKIAFYEHIYDEFNRVRSICVKITKYYHRDVARHIDAH